MTTSHYTFSGERKQSQTYPFPLKIEPLDLRHHPICPSATSTVMDGPDPEDFHLFATTCKRWSCSYCARRKISQLAVWTAAACPTRLLTLTVDPALWPTPKAAWEGTASKVAELIRKLRPRFGEIEYLRVVELHKSGYPHYHMLVRSGFLPHACVKDTWASLTGATYVDLRPVDKNWRAYWYLTKYLAKMHNKLWTDRHVSYSRKFFPPKVQKQERDDSLKLRGRYDDHPYRWLADRQWGNRVSVLAPHHYLCHEEHFPTKPNVTNWMLGIPAEGTAEKPKQRKMISPDEPS